MKFVTAQEVFKNPESRKGLPAWTYNNAELTQLETEEVFLRNWLFVAHVSEIPKRGDYQCLSMGNERAVVVRDEDDQIRAFRNMCRHRASRVVADEKGHCGKSFICPFHGWSYNLDGSLKNIPKADSFPQIDRQEFGLKTLDCEIWHGLIFIRFGGNGSSVAETFVEAEEEISLYQIDDMEVLEGAYNSDFDLDWKAVLDVDLEGYHVPIGHPGLLDLMGSTYIDQKLEGGLSRSSGSFKGRKLRQDINREYVDALPKESYLPESHQHEWIYWGMFPGLVITLFPDQIEIYQFLPTGSQKCIMRSVSYALPDDRPEMQKARKLNQTINMDVGGEDLQLIEWVAEGMRSKAFDGLMLSDLEIGVASFHNQMRELLPVMTLEQAPDEGTMRLVNESMQAKTKVAAVS
jgi:phenylpropionate dioxygenase-like ring-hydroxylating dioxygenase large terminal subunit